MNTLTTYQPNNTWHVSDGFSKVRGPHTLKFGGEFRYLQINERNTCAPNGDFTFDGTETGNEFADFLIGVASNYNQADSQAYYGRHKYAAGFVQDSWRVRSNLTFNFGVRWDLMQYWSEKFNVSRERLKQAVEKVGVSASAVEEELKNK